MNKSCTGKEKIIQAAVKLFAEKGFKATTVRMISSEAGVSDGLLYKHFQNKEAVYQEIKDKMFEPFQDYFHQIDKLEHNEESFIKIMFFLHHMFINVNLNEECINFCRQLFIKSLAEDGDFSKTLLSGGYGSLKEKLKLCLADSQLAYDNLDNALWFAHHIPFTVDLFSKRFDNPLVEYNKEALVMDSLSFTLRGLGFSEDLISKIDPIALEKEFKF